MKRLVPALVLTPVLLCVVYGSAGAQWTPQGRLVSAPTGVHSSSAVVADGTGGAYVVWQERSGSYPFEVYATRLLANGTTAAGFPTTGAPQSGGEPTPLFVGAGEDGAGGVIVGWGWTAAFAKRIQSDGSPAPGWSATGNSYTLAAPPNGWTTDGQGGGWFSYRTETSFCPSTCTYSSTAYARHVASTGALSAGEFLIANSSFPGGAQASFEGAAPGSGFAHGYNESYTGRIARVNAAHQLAWNFALDFEHISVYAVVEDGSGGALAVTEGGLGSLPPRLLRIGAGGAAYPGWPAGGAAIRVPDALMGDLTAIRSGDASAIVGWTEYDPAGTKLKLQKLTSAGAIAPGWPAAGLVVCDAPSSRDLLVLVPDGAGGALLAWRDTRSEAAGDLYAAHVSAAAELDPAYATNGTGIATLAGGVQDLRMTPVGGGSAILAWTDLNAGSTVRAQMLPLQGSAGVDPDALGPLALRGFVPDPAPAMPRVAFSLANASDASLELFDVTGRRVHEQSWSGLSAGPHAFTLAPARPLSPGLYLMRLRAGGEERVRRGIVSR